MEKGERVTICRHGVAISDLVCTAAGERKPRQFGTLGDKIKIYDSDWAKPQNDFEAWLKGDIEVRILLDTHVFIQLVRDGQENFSPRTRSLFADEDSDLLLSAVSMTEIAVKTSINKLAITVPDASTPCKTICA